MKPSKAAFVSIQELVQSFFEKHLTLERQASRNTMLAYRDSLKLFLRYAAERSGGAADQLDHTILDSDIVRSFLEWLAVHRKCGARTRNHRLAAIKAFARYVASVAPEHLERCRRIRELLPARFEHPEVEYLDDDEILKLVSAINPVAGRRDRALLLLLYNTGARVQEIVDLDLATSGWTQSPSLRSRVRVANSGPVRFGQGQSKLSKHGSRSVATAASRSSSTAKADA